MAERQRAVDVVSHLRVITAVVAASLGVAVWQELLPGLVLGVPLVVFVGLVIAHERVYRALGRARRAVRHYHAGVLRIDDAWAGHGDTGEDLAPSEHPYAADLDLFGPGSLFELVCTARTAAGRRTLAAWLLAPAPLPVVRAREAAVEELRERLDLREALALASDDLDASIDPPTLVRWGTEPPMLSPAQARRWGALAWLVPAGTVGAAVAAVVFGPAPALWWAVAAMGLVTWGVGRVTGRFVQRAQLAAERSAAELLVLARVLACLERERFDDPTLAALRATLVADEASASRSIRRLGHLLGWAEAARSQVFAPVAFALLWSLHFALAIERWRRRHGPAIAGWLGALGELEALLSLSALAFEHPDDPFPELVPEPEGGPLLEGRGLGHPLLPAAACVRNPVELGATVRARVVSGSNMSGKSTYLRTVGVNVVLALAGAPVRAEQLRLSALRIGATLRVQDSLQHGASRFYAEITRLRQVVALADEGPGVLFLLDEILHGTNSHDRRIGGHAIVEGLLEHGAIGLVTTHDLALAAGTADPRVANVHFVDELRDGALRFDYRLHPGVVRTSNALALMKAVGLPVPPGEG